MLTLPTAALPAEPELATTGTQLLQASCASALSIMLAMEACADCQDSCPTCMAGACDCQVQTQRTDAAYMLTPSSS